MARYASRKFLLALVTQVQATALLALGLVPAETWGAVIGAVVALYLGSNVAQKATTKPDAQ